MALAILSVVTLGLVVAALSGVTLAKTTAYTPPLTTPTPSAPNSAPVAAFIGDSFTAGAGGVSPLWPELVSEAEGWHLVNLGYGGTGFLSSHGLTSSVTSLVAHFACPPAVGCTRSPR